MTTKKAVRQGEKNRGARNAAAPRSRYRKEVSEEEKEQIIRDFLPYIKYTAGRLSWRLPPQLTSDDLVSAGLMGLLDALERYEHGRVKLKTFAEFRIKGAMLDEIRAFEWVPRSTKSKMNSLKQAHAKLEKELGRFPEDEEVAESLNMSLDEYYRTLREGSCAMTLRLEDFEERGGAGDGLNIMECIADPDAESPFDLIEAEDRKRALAQCIDDLPEKEKLLLSLYYWEELTMKEIGKVMHLTEGRVCQIHAQALVRLKARLAAKRERDGSPVGT